MAKVSFINKIREQRGGEPVSNGGSGAQKTAMKSSSVAAQALTATFERAGQLDVSSALVAQHGPLLNSHAGELKQVKELIEHLAEGQRATMAQVPGSVLDALGPGFARLDDTQRGTALTDTLAALADLAQRPDHLSEAHAAILGSVARSAGKLRTGTLGATFAQVTRQLVAEARPEVLRAVEGALQDKAEALSGLWVGDAGAGAFVAASEIALGAAGTNTDLGQLIGQAAQKRGLELSPAQRELFQAIGTQARQGVVDAQARGQAVAAGLAAAKQQLVQGAAQRDPAHAAQLQTLMASADMQLAPDARLAWYQAVNAQAGQAPDAQAAVAALQLSVLSTERAPAPAQLNEMTQQLVALQAATRLTSQQLGPLIHRLVRTAPPDQLGGVLAQTSALLAPLVAQGKAMPDAASIASLGESIIGHAATLAPANGPKQLAAAAIAGAPDDAVRGYVAREVVPFALATAKAEPGPAHDLEHASFAADLAGLGQAGVSLRAIQAAFPNIPADALPALLNVGLRKGLKPEAWAGELGKVFKLTGKNKEAARKLRTLLLLADKAGAQTPALLSALLKIDKPAKSQGRELNRIASALLLENNLQITAPQIDGAVAALGQKQDVAGAIETKLQAAMTQKLGLAKLINGGAIKATEHGIEMVQTKLNAFFAQGANAPQVNQKILGGMLASVLEDRFQDFRFTLPATQRQLKSLNAAQRAKWLDSSTMSHVRFDAAGQKRFDDRVTYAASLGRELAARFTQAWGPLDQTRARLEQGLNTLRNGDKNDPNRRAVVEQVQTDGRKVDALKWATELGALTPQTCTPLQYARLGDGRLDRARPAIGDAAYGELRRTLKIDDLAFSEVTTNDAPDLDTLFRLGSANCLKGWPNDPILLGYAVDANKRMIVTKNAKGEERRAMLRLVERQDAGHVGEPMLVLERTYPDAAAEEEKQRAVEHALRRAADMGIPVAYPLEYYWEASKTGRAGQIKDMNLVLEDLNRRYHTEAQQVVAKVLNPGGNNPQEYIDSAPPTGAAGSGVVGIRRYPGNANQIYENKFLLLTPRKD